MCRIQGDYSNVLAASSLLMLMVVNLWSRPDLPITTWDSPLLRIVQPHQLHHPCSSATQQRSDNRHEKRVLSNFVILDSQTCKPCFAQCCTYNTILSTLTSALSSHFKNILWHYYNRCLHLKLGSLSGKQTPLHVCQLCHFRLELSIEKMLPHKMQDTEWR